MKEKLIISFIYGFFLVNYLDLIFNPRIVPGWHLVLTLIYLALPLFISRNIYELVFYTLFVSLVNDLTYYVFGNLFLNRNVNLLLWYSYQLGLSSKPGWVADFMFFKVRVTSQIMALSIYLRIICLILLYRRLK